MREGWTEHSLSDLIRIEHGWPFKSEFFSTELTGKPIVVGVGNFQYNGGFRFNSTALKEYRSEYPAQYLLNPGNILLIMTCQTAGGEILGIPGRIPDDGRDYLHNQRLGKVVLTAPELTSEDFLYYVFLSPDFNRSLVATASGTKILHTAPSRIEAYRFQLPPKPLQERIALLLGALDRKIELNRQTNETLESLTTALFNEWFVHFGPVSALSQGRSPEGITSKFAHLFPTKFDGDLPEGWQPTSIYEFADVIYGAPFASQYFNEERVGLPLLRIRDLEDHKPVVYTDEAHPKAYRVVPGDIVVGMDGEFRVHLWSGPVSLLNQRMCCFKPKPGIATPFVANGLRPQMDFLERSKVGTTVIHLGKSDIDAMTFVGPGEPILKAFSSVVEPLAGRIVRNSLESMTLVEMRDLLLPKLLSGQVTMREAENMVVAAL